MRAGMLTAKRRMAGAALAAALSLAPAWVAAQTPPPAPTQTAPPLLPMAEPQRSTRSTGPYPVWQFGPDGPIMPPQGFAPMGAIFGASGPLSGSGGGACVVPVPPSCPRLPATYSSEPARQACEALVSRHVQEVFAYRECLEGESQRAVRAVNEAIRLVKCRKPDLKDCK